MNFKNPWLAAARLEAGSCTGKGLGLRAEAQLVNALQIVVGFVVVVLKLSNRVDG